eukprot:6491593-Amphidinium_carterae.1
MLYRVDKASGLEEHFAGTQEVVEFAEGKVIQSVDKNSFAVLFASKPKKLLCIPDSGCRRNVAGRDWHQKLQRQLNVQGLCGIYKPEREKFRFGDSRVEESEGSWLYPVKKANQLMVFNVACVNTDCPPLLSVSSMASLGVVINFVDNEIELRGLGTTVDMQHVASGHPVLEFDVPEVTDDVPTAFTCLQEQAVSALGVSWEMPDSQEVQVLHSELVQCEHAKLLELLQNITIPPNRSRSKKLTGSDQVVVEHPPRSMLLGLYTKQGVGLSNHTEGKVELLKHIRRVARGRVKDEEYTSVMINKMDEMSDGVALHRDMYNMAEQDNWVLQLGQFKGGRIWCEGAGRQQMLAHARAPPSCPSDIRGGYLRADGTGWIHFNPQKWHLVERVQGVRYSIVLFNSKYVSRAPTELWDRLTCCGFPCSKLRSKLARAEHCKEVPRGVRKRLLRHTESLSSLWTPRPASKFRLRLMQVSDQHMLLVSWVTFTDEVIRSKVSLQLPHDWSQQKVWSSYMEIEPEVIVCEHVGANRVDQHLQALCEYHRSRGGAVLWTCNGMLVENDLEPELLDVPCHEIQEYVSHFFRETDALLASLVHDALVASVAGESAEDRRAARQQRREGLAGSPYPSTFAARRSGMDRLEMDSLRAMVPPEAPTPSAESVTVGMDDDGVWHPAEEWEVAPRSPMVSAQPEEEMMDELTGASSSALAPIPEHDLLSDGVVHRPVEVPAAPEHDLLSDGVVHRPVEVPVLSDGVVHRPVEVPAAPVSRPRTTTRVRYLPPPWRDGDVTTPRRRAYEQELDLPWQRSGRPRLNEDDDRFDAQRLPDWLQGA